MQKITLFCLDSISNAGEDILGTTTEYLINECDKNITLERRQLLPSWKSFSFPFKLIAVFAKLVFLLGRAFKGNTQYKILNCSYWIKYSHYYTSIIKHTDKVIFSVGMFKYSTQNFSYIYHMIVSIADKYHKDVMISAASVEKPKQNDWRSRQLGKTLNYPSLKIFSTRDGKEGKERLLDYGAPKKLRIDEVGDPALWMKEAYEYRQASAKNVVGINVIRSNIFLDYGGNISQERVIEFYIHIIKELEKEGENWVLFCDGMECDYQVGLQILRQLGLSKDKLLAPKKNGKELMDAISACKCVVASRFHACLTAYTLHVPFIGFIWDDKIKFFSYITGMQRYFLHANDFQAKKALDLLQYSLQNEPDYSISEGLRTKTKKSISDFLTLN